MAFSNTNTGGQLNEELTSRGPAGQSTKQYTYLKDPSVSMAIEIFHDKEFNEKIKERIKTAISKFSTSRKTKIVYELMQKNQIIFGQMNSSTPIEIVAKEKTLYQIFINPFSVQNYGGVSRHEKLRDIISKINKTKREIKATKSLITQYQVLKLDSLQKDKEEYEEQFLAEIDWLKVVDYSYFGVLQFFAFNATNKNKPEKIKVYKTTEDLLLKQLRKILSRVDSSLKPQIKTEEEQDIKNETDIKIIKMRLAVQFFMLTYYLQMSTKSALVLLKEHRSEFVRLSLDSLFPEKDLKANKLSNETPYENHKKKEKIQETADEASAFYEKVLKDFAKFKPNVFEDFAQLLEILDILKISKSTFKTLMVQNVGEDVYYNYYTFLPKLISVFIVSTNSDLFENFYEIDNKLQKRLEELILNQKSQTIIKENRYV